MSDNANGVKHDSQKPRADLLLDFGNALLAVAEVSTFGANKYAPHDWLLVPNAKERYTAAMLRHLLQSGIESKDSETQIEHMAHVAWNALAVLELSRRGK